ncbi:hypothetical protein SK128_001628 [Halocaridina rubra]|uniref:MARVEL domain-containing protein n=1 Tax=Halocaridina rubra TaxID=373956 RepID=A0AAN8X0S8_HALRR
MDVNNLRHPSAILKMVEILLLIVTMALFFSRIRGWSLFVASVIIGCFLNAIVFLINIFMGYDQHQKTPLELILYSYYTLSLFISGILQFTGHFGIWIASGVFCLVLSVIYGMEIYLSYMNLVGRPVASFPVMSQAPQPPAAAPSQSSVFPADPYPPPPTYPNNPPMQQVDLGNPFDERQLQQL